MSKKKARRGRTTPAKAKRITPRKPCPPDEFARRMARAGVASLDLLMRYEEHVVADPDRWAVRFGATRDEMLASIALLRARVLAETLHTSLIGAGV